MRSTNSEASCWTSKRKSAQTVEDDFPILVHDSHHHLLANKYTFTCYDLVTLNCPTGPTCYDFAFEKNFSKSNCRRHFLYFWIKPEILFFRNAQKRWCNHIFAVNSCRKTLQHFALVLKYGFGQACWITMTYKNQQWLIQACWSFLSLCLIFYANEIS